MDLGKNGNGFWTLFGSAHRCKTGYLRLLYSSNRLLLLTSAVLFHDLVKSSGWSASTVIRIHPPDQPCGSPRSLGCISSPCPGPMVSAYQTHPPYPSLLSCCRCSSLPPAGTRCTYDNAPPSALFLAKRKSILFCYKVSTYPMPR